ncbi:MAG TPA: ABC transporter permease [Vicinamibacterales bacterium]|nr:ABC transporter permease [Vicinamibacterales bacterium]
MSFLRRLWFLARRGRLDDELRAEIEFHIEQKTRRLVAEGMDEASARGAALRQFGNATRVREDSRAYWGFGPLDLLFQDIRFACRAIARQPMPAVIAVLSLGSAMAAGAAVFSLADAVLFAKLPVADPDRLLVLRWVAGRQHLYSSLNGWNDVRDGVSSSTSFSYDAFEAARSQLRGRADVFGFADLYQVSLAADSDSRVATAQAVSGNYYAALRIRPASGRFITMSDDRADAPEPVAVISYALWQRRFGARADTVGRVVRVNGVPTTIVGVAPPGFNGTRQVGETSDVTLPLALRDRFVREPSPDALKGRHPAHWWLVLMARLPAGANVSDVQPEIETTIRAAIAATNPEALKGPFSVELRSAARGMFEQRQELVEPITIMAGIVVVVVLIACANLANLLLARGAARDREVAVRLAIGGSRGHIVRQFLAESAIIGLAAGGVGLVAAQWLAQGLIPALGVDPAAGGLSVALNGRVLAFGFAASIVCTMIFGLVPAFRSSTVPAIRSIRGASDDAGAFAVRGPRLRLARTLLAAQIALSVVVLVAAGLLVHSMRNLERVNPGFEPRGVLLFRVDASLLGYDDDHIHRIVDELLARLRALPGVQGASFSQHGLLYGWSSRSSLHQVDGKPPAADIDINRLVVDERFLATFRIPLLAGTGFTGAERKGEIIPVVINRTFARLGFNTIDAVGRTFRISNRPAAPTYRVIGVTADIHVVDLKQPPPPTVFFSYRTQVLYGGTFAVRTEGPPEDLAGTVREVVAAVDKDLPIDRVRSEEAEIRHSLREERLFATLATLLGGLALLLACVGVYGLMAYSVTRRTQEIGIRMALGAERRRVQSMVLADAGRLTAAGLAAGLGAASLSSRYLESLLFGLEPTDPTALAGALLLLLGVALIAAYVPARRAARVDPLTALRAE